MEQLFEMKYNHWREKLDKFIYYYNFKRTNQSYRLKNKIPYQDFFSGMQKHILPKP